MESTIEPQVDNLSISSHGELPKIDPPQLRLVSNNRGNHTMFKSLYPPIRRLMSGASWEHEDSLVKIMIICAKLSGVPPDPSPVDKLYPEAYKAIKPLTEEQVQLLKTTLTPEARQVINTIYSLTPSAVAALQRITSPTGSDMPDDASPHLWSVAYENAVPHSSYRRAPQEPDAPQVTANDAVTDDVKIFSVFNRIMEKRRDPSPQDQAAARMFQYGSHSGWCHSLTAEEKVAINQIYELYPKYHDLVMSHLSIDKLSDMFEETPRR